LKKVRRFEVNVGKSLKIAMAMREIKQVEMARDMKVSQVYISRLANSQHAGIGTVSKLAKALGMSVSEFIALGED
jgi:transcriptional regulator with XRE-family HTH domain